MHTLDAEEITKIHVSHNISKKIPDMLAGIHSGPALAVDWNVPSIFDWQFFSLVFSPLPFPLASKQGKKCQTVFGPRTGAARPLLVGSDEGSAIFLCDAYNRY